MKRIFEMINTLTAEKERNEKFIKGWWAVDRDTREDDISTYLRKMNEFTKICAQLEILEEVKELLEDGEEDQINMEGMFSGIYWQMQGALKASKRPQDEELREAALKVWNKQFPKDGE